MHLYWQVGVVNRITQINEGMQELDVVMQDGALAKAIHYMDEHPLLVENDQVLLNTSAVSLQLGTGGYHFVHAVLPREPEPCGIQASLNPYGITPNNSRDHGHPTSDYQTDGHIMKLRYTSLQRPVLAVEESVSPHHEQFIEKKSLQGMQVLIGELHSMLPAAVCRIRQLERKLGHSCRIAYIMSDGGALPIAFSHHITELRRLGWLAGTITYGHAYGGDVETVNKYTALLAARHVLFADMTIVVMGPGSVGTGTWLGFSGLETGELINATTALGGVPMMIPRISFADSRKRHTGISHHTLTVLQEIAQSRCTLVLPELQEEQGMYLRTQVKQAGLENRHTLLWRPPVSRIEWEEAMAYYPLSISTMGRELNADLAYFAGIGTAVDASWDYWTENHQ